MATMAKPPPNLTYSKNISESRKLDKNPFSPYFKPRQEDPAFSNSANQRDYSTVANLLIEHGRWVFLSNKFVSYWPFSIDNRLNFNRNKYLTFDLPSVSLILSLLYISLNACYILQYFYFKFSEDAEDLQPFDLILITIWDLMVVVGVATIRLYGIWKLREFGTFWESILGIVSGFNGLSSEQETEEKFKEIRKWTLKWVVLFGFFGAVDCSAVIYHYTFVSGDSLLTISGFEYLEIVICIHNSSSLLLIFFIKIMTYSFTVCKRKVEQISRCSIRPLEYSDFGRSGPGSGYEVGSISNKMTSLEQVFQVIEDTENCVARFNALFGFILFLETVITFWQVMFSLYFLHITPVDNFAFGVNMAVPIITYPACMVSLCVASSGLTSECGEMIRSFQKVNGASITVDGGHKIQILVSRLTSSPPRIGVSQLFQIQESLLGSALNALATYFIVLVQMRQFTKTN